MLDFSTSMKTALIIVDAQKDFPLHLEVVDRLIDLAEEADLVIASKTVHSKDHFSFAEFGPHCIHGTKGVKLEDRIAEWADYTITRVCPQGVEHYSAFDGGTLRPKESLEEILVAEKIGKVWIGGFGHGWDVPQTAFDANALGYPTTVWLEAVNEMSPETILKLEHAGVNVRG
jgi:nicotinamidase/pyrazinamidase